MKKNNTVKKSAKKNSMKKNINLWIAQAQEDFLLQEWNITKSWTGEDEEVPMAVGCVPAYRMADIEINLRLCKKYDNSTVRFYCYHEVFHIRLWEFATLAQQRKATPEQKRDAEEEFVQICVKAFLKWRK